MPQEKLTKRLIQTLGVQPTEYMVWDAALRRFGVKVSPSGHKTYLIKYRHHRRQRKLSIGPTDLMTPEQARSAAMDLLNQVAQGRDPATARQVQLAEPTVDEAFTKFMVRHVEARRKPRTVVAYRSVYERCIKAKLGRRRLSDVTPVDIADLHAGLAETKHQANFALAVIGSFFSWCERPEVRLRDQRSNPAYRLEGFKLRNRERFLSAAELGRLGQALRAAEAREWPWAIAGIRLLIFTGARRNEILHLRWEYVDFERHRLNLPDSKSGAKVIVLSQAAIEILRDLELRRKALSASPWVLPAGRDPSRPLHLQNVWERVRAAAGLDGVRLHDLRHSFASMAAARGTQQHLIKTMLGHADMTTTSIYMHYADQPIRNAFDDVAGQIAAAMGEGARAAPIAP